MAGRPKANIDWKKVDQYLQAQCDGAAIASLLGIAADTLYRAVEREQKVTFAAYSQQHKSIGALPPMSALERRTAKDTVRREWIKVLPYLYVVHCHTTDFYKIGISAIKPVLRLSSLQVGCPFKLEMIHTFVCDSAQSAIDLERDLHVKLKHFLVRGEWFELKEVQLKQLLSDLET